MQYVTYRSLAVVPQETSTDISAILSEALANNPRLGITGFLYFENGAFFQYIEGPGEALELLLSRLKRDRRHFALEVLEQGTCATRRFPDWDMGFHRALAAEHPLESNGPDGKYEASDVITFLEGLKRA